MERHSERLARLRPLRLLAVLAATVILGSILPGAGPAPAEAADPAGGKCQEKLLGKTAPAKEDCVVLKKGTVDHVASALPAGFTESVVLNGLVNPTNLEFAADGRVFVAEKSGVIKVYNSVSDTSPTSFSALTTSVHNYWDRGLLGLALDPSLTNPALPLRPWVYVMYSYDHVLGGSGPVGSWNDNCPTPPGPTTDGCVISGRLSRFTVSGKTISGPETVLIEDWCQQFPSHSIGALGFGPDGALYVSGGDGASFNQEDYGQLGGSLAGTPTAKNPCGDPPGGAMAPPSAEGGALRSQDVRTDGSPTGNSYATTVLQDAPVAYWRLGESSGTTAADSAGTNTGTYIGGVTLGQPGVLSGDANTAVRLDGTSGYVAVPDANSLDLANGPLTYEFWAKRTDAGTYYQLIYSKKSQGNIFFLNNKLMFDNDSSVLIQESGATTDTAWHHFAITRSGSGAANTRMYKDGVDVTAEVDTAHGLTSNAIPLSLGRYDSTNGLYFNGSVDEIAVYPTALSSTRVQAHFSAATTSTSVDPATLDGAILRVDPVTGAAFPGNPFSTSADPNKQRIIAYGFRNPFRFRLRSGTNELWVGDVGWSDWEEINRVANIGDATAENFGWPCYEGLGRQAGYDNANLNVCENLYAAGSGAITAPVYTYAHTGNVVDGETCPTGSSSITGLAFYPETGGNFPSQYRGGLFFADYSRNCIWWMAKGANGQPDPSTRAVFLAPAANPIDLEIGLDGALYYVDFGGGTVRKVAFSSGNQPPTAVVQANPTSGPAPLTVNFNGTGSTDPEGASLSYAWDLDGDGALDDSTSPTPTWVYQTPATITVTLRVTDPGSLADTDSVVVSPGNTPPVPAIQTPVAGTTAAVGEVIQFSGSATDTQDGTIPASRLSWLLRVQHCPSNCHTHDIQTFSGVASGSFSAPDHEYPSYLELILTATDANGAAASVTRRIDPKTVNLSFATIPTGLTLTVDGVVSTAPFSRTVIQGSSNSITATSPQTLGNATYSFQSWSDGGAATHTVTANTAGTYTATYAQSGSLYTLVPSADAEIRANKATKNFGTTTTLGVKSGLYRSYLKFVIPALAGAVQTAKLRLFVVDASTNGGTAYSVGNGWTETGIIWNNAPPISGAPLATSGAAALGTWIEFDVKPAIVTSTTISIAVSDGVGDMVDYSSRTGGNSPQLVISTTP
jgi:glucose/arabinose dehydrogenase/PKD repeat protein